MAAQAAHQIRLSGARSGSSRANPDSSETPCGGGKIDQAAGRGGVGGKDPSKVRSIEGGSLRSISERLRNGDEDALRTIMHRYHEKLKAVSSGICRNPMDVEEVLQDVFLTAFQKADQFEGRAAFSTWLHRVTVNRSLMKVRGEKNRRHHVPLDLECSSLSTDLLDSYEQKSNPENSLIRGELRRRVEKAAGALPTNFRSVFYLRDVLGFSIRETSETLKITGATTKSRLLRSRAQIVERLSAS